MQPTHKSMLRRTSSGTSPRVTTSETAKRPPGFRTRNASRNTRSLSPDRLMTQLLIITSTELSGSGMLSISPLRNSTFSTPGIALVLARERQHFTRHIEAVGFARRSDTPRGQQHVNSAGRAEIEDRFPRVELR